MSIGEFGKFPLSEKLAYMFVSIMNSDKFEDKMTFAF